MDKQIEAPSRPKCLCELCTCDPKTHFCEICAPNLPFDHISSYQNDYIPRDIPLQKQQYEETEIIKSPPFTAKTSYQTDYTQKPIPKAAVVEEQEYQPSIIPFDAKSTYQQEFISRPLPKQQAYSEDEEPIKGPKFDADSTYNTHYIKHKTKPCTCPAAQGLLPWTVPSPNHQYYVKVGDKYQIYKQ